jgi:hypothetical protein
MSTLSRHKDMYEAIKTEASHSVSAPEVDPPNSEQQQDPSDAEMNEVDRDADELDELQVGASLIPAEAEPMHEDEQQSLVKEENKDETISNAYARDFEALVEFLTSADAEGGEEDEIFDRLREKVVHIGILTSYATDHLIAACLSECPKLGWFFGAPCSSRDRRS